MEFEIDFLPVGEESQSGDAICLRYSDDGGTTWNVGVIDGGSQDSGIELCEHIVKHYQTNTVNFLICTHPDQDHASGLSVVLDTLTVEKVLIHCPWDYVEHFFDSVNDGRVTKESLRKKLIDGHPFAYKVYEKALEKNIPIYHPFSDRDDHKIPALNISGPSSGFYLSQLVGFRSITDVTEDSFEGSDFLKSLLEKAQVKVKLIAELWDDEKLVDPGDNATSSENNSSVISFFDFGGKKILFTADAGVLALDAAATRIEELGHELQSFSFIQVPHHGSKRNIGPTVLNRLVGSPKLFGTATSFTALISAAKEGAPKHPNKRVINAFTRRGAKVSATNDGGKCFHSNGMPAREGWSSVDPLPFYSEVEDDD